MKWYNYINTFFAMICAICGKLIHGGSVIFGGIAYHYSCLIHCLKKEEADEEVRTLG